MKKINYYIERMLGSEKYPLDSIGEFNPILKIVSYEDKEKNLSSGKAIIERIVNECQGDNKKFKDISSKTKYILPKQKITINLLKKFGYVEIPPSPLN